MSTRVRTRSRWWRSLLGAVVLIGVLAGCDPLRAGLGTTNGSCYVAIPTAQDAVGNQGRLLGLRLEAVNSIGKADQRILAVAMMGPHKKGQDVCLVAYTGKFSASSLKKAVGAPSGTLAVVVLDYPSNVLLGTILFRHLPIRFGHSHFG
jgi:hypothetical protein